LAEPYDTLVLRFGAEGAGFRLSAGDPALETDSNTVARAWRAWCERAGRWPGLDVTLEKGSPMGAGLGGGSADAAVVLRELDARAGEAALGRAELMEVAAGIGADVPFFLLDGPAWAEGIGEKLTPVDVDLRGMTLVLVCPPEHVSSAWAYGAWDRAQGCVARAPENAKGFLTYGGSEFRNSPRSRILLFNSFEDVVFMKYPNLLRHKEKLLSLGAAGAVMSGSGASLLALYRDPGLARRTLEEFGRVGIAAFLHTL
jgi:4-diphosphocytidyl-2-C-methyl-D-erythritol kinase